MGIKVLAGIASAENASPAARVSAAVALLDQGWGKAQQSHVGLDGSDIKVTIRQIIDPSDSSEPTHDLGTDWGPALLMQIIS